jgi:hypothetical protein
MGIYYRTATSEGTEMTRVLSTLSQIEKSRFEAYRRCTFSAKAIREYVAHMLLAHAEQLKDRTRVSVGLLGSDGCGTGVPHLERSIVRMNTAATTTAKNRQNRRPLHDMVQPGSADSIVVIVTALAKAYAQRLVAAARRVSADSHGPILVEHIQAAYEARVRGGVDPGFSITRPSRRRAFKSSSSMLWSCQGKIASAALGIVDRHELLRLAALQAQDDYDAYMEGKASKKEEEIDSRAIVSDLDNVDMPQYEIDPLNVPKNEEDLENLDSNQEVAEDSNIIPKKEDSSSDSSPEEILQSLSHSFDSTDKIKEEPIHPNSPVVTEPILEDKTTLKLEEEILPLPVFEAAPSPPKISQVTTTTTVKSKPISMEDALLNLMDDDSDDDDSDD